MIDKILFVIMRNPDNLALVSLAKEIVKELQKEFEDYKSLEQALEKEITLKNIAAE